MFYLTTHSTHFIYGYMASDGCSSENSNKSSQSYSGYPNGFKADRYWDCIETPARTIEQIYNVNR